MILGIDFNFILSLMIAFLDFLPFFGTGTAFVPWIIYEILTADYKMAIGMLMLYPITQIVHRTIEPKLLGDSVGLNPLLTLMLIYVGFKIGSVIGMIFAVPAAAVIKYIVPEIYRAGALNAEKEVISTEKG
jgi:predicted PurR-regulated permease PerM